MHLCITPGCKITSVIRLRIIRYLWIRPFYWRFVFGRVRTNISRTSDCRTRCICSDSSQTVSIYYHKYL